MRRFTYAILICLSFSVAISLIEINIRNNYKRSERFIKPSFTIHTNRDRMIDVEGYDHQDGLIMYTIDGNTWAIHPDSVIGISSYKKQ